MSLLDEHSQRRKSIHSDPFSAADIYYGDQSTSGHKNHPKRHFSAIVEPGTHPVLDEIKQHRRGSQDPAGQTNRKFLVPVESTLKALLAQEDTSKKGQITIEDTGPKVSSFLHTHYEHKLTFTDFRSSVSALLVLMATIVSISVAPTLCLVCSKSSP